MFSFLKNHPFAVEAFFEKSTVLTFAVPKDKLINMVPEPLELDLYDKKWAFVAVAIVKTKGLRPKGFLRCMGNNFFLVGYRVFVRYTNAVGKRLRGLYILKSETDSRKMEVLGNIFTHYNYTTTDISVKKTGLSEEIMSFKSGFSLVTENGDTAIPLPSGSPFADWKQARRYAGPLPFTFTYDEKKKEVLIIEGVRQKWEPLPVKVKNYQFRFLTEFGLSDAILANAFEVNNVPYYWKKGRKEIWR
jgi:hypothetical protein